MRHTSHKTRSIFERHNIVSASDLRAGHTAESMFS